MKRQANTLSALIQNFDTVEKVIETSQKSAGSALKENERYLDSIQGRIDQFNNALQSMWNNILDDDLIKFIVQAGTELLKFIDNLGVVKTLIIGIGTYLIQKNFKGDLWGGLFNVNSIEEAKDRLKGLKEEIATLQGKKQTKSRNKRIQKKQEQYVSLEATINEYDELSKKVAKLRIESDGAKKALDGYNKELADKAANNIEATDDEIAHLNDLNNNYQKSVAAVRDTEEALKKVEVQAYATGTTGLNAGNKIKTGFVSASKAVWKFAKEMAMSMAYTMAFTAIFEALGNIWNGLAPLFDEIYESPEKLQEKLSELQNELSSVESELDTLQSELEDTNERIEELMEQGSLTFVEQEELNKLKSVSAELKSQIALQETLQKSLQQSTNSASVQATNSYLDTSFMSDKSRTERQEEAKETGSAIGQIAGTIIGGIVGTIIGGGITLTSGGTAAVPGAAIGIAAGSAIAGWIGGEAGSALAGSSYDSEQSVGEAMDSMLETRKKLKQAQNDALAKNDAEAYNEATEALATYDKQMATHISQIQQNYNAMDWETATTEQRQQMIEYADWLDKYNINMGTDGAKSNAITRIFGDEATGNIAEARDEIERLKKNLAEAKKNGEGVDDALANLENFKLDLTSEEVGRIREMGIYLYEVEDALKEIVKTESEFIDSDLEDVAKDINKITDGLGSLKSAFEEVVEEGVLTAKTVMSLKEELKINDYSDIEGVTDAWRKYLDIMMSGAATTEEMTKATESLAQSIIEAALAEDDLRPENKMEYVAQLRQLGITNAEEYIDDLLQKNMVNEVANQMKSDTLSEERIQKITEAYGVEANAVEDIIEKLKEKEQLEQQIADAQKEQDAYQDWRKSFKSVEDDLKIAKNNNPLYEKAKTIKDELDMYLVLMDKYKKGQVAASEVLSVKKSLSFYDEETGDFKFDGQSFANTTYLSDYLTRIIFDAEQEIASLQTEYQRIWDEGIAKGFIDKATGKIINEDYADIIKGIEDQIKGIEGEIDTELTAEVELKLELQNKSDLVDDIQSVFDTLVNAQKEYEETGYLSVDTLQTLLQLEPKYLDLLVDEQGNLNLTKDALYNVARARITDMGIQSQKNILEQATALASKGSSDALREQIEVMQNANEVGSDFVEVEMAKIRAILAERVAAKELTQAEADAFIEGTMNQIEAVQVATKSALDNLNNSLSSSGNTATAEVEDAFQKAMDYWENRIGANQSLYEQIQNDIDLLEKKGQIAGESYYEAQMAVENERLEHLKAQREEATQYLKQLDSGSEKWWEVANALNDIENEIDDVTLSLQDLKDAIDQVHWNVFDEAHERMNDLQTQLSNVREILSVDEDSFFTDEGEWTETGVAVLGTYIQEIELYKSALDDVNNELANLDISDFDSEQEYYDKLTELTNQQHEYTMAINDSEQSVVDMYESSVDAIEEYTQTLVESYSEYIDMVKEALDAERDLYDFKKNVQKQNKDIAEIERRIASLSGSTNKADIAERRKLEAQLYESRESLNDTYYDHAKQSQQDALDTEREAYEENMNKFVEGLRVSLEEATRNMDEFIMSVTSIVTLNADTVLSKYESTELPLSTTLTNPWEAAKEASKSYSGDALALLSEWTQDGGLLVKFNTNGTENLTSPWNAGKKAAQGFGESIKTVMEGVYTNIQSNVLNSITELNKLKQKYAEINDEEVRVNTGNGSGGDGSGGSGGDGGSQKKYYATATLSVAGVKLTTTQSAYTESAAKKAAGIDIARKYEELNKRYNVSEEEYTKLWNKTYKNRIEFKIDHYAKGTMDTKRNKLAVVDELGPELILHADSATGRLQYLTKGSGVVPHDATAELMKLADIGVDGLMAPKFDSGINMIENYITKPEFKIDIEEFVHVDRVDQDTLPKLEAIMDKKINDFSKALNYSIKRFTR